MGDAIAEIRWFFGQTLVWIWGRDLLNSARLMAIKRMPVYGVRLGTWALYVVHLEQRIEDDQ